MTATKISKRNLMLFATLSIAIVFFFSCNNDETTEQTPKKDIQKIEKRTISQIKADIKKTEQKVEQAKLNYEKEQNNLQIQKAELAAQQLLNPADIPLFTGAEPSGVIKVYNSTFNELVDAIEPIKKTDSHPVHKTIRVCVPFTNYCYSKTITVCDGNYTAEVKNTTFSITPSNINISGNVTGTFHCGIGLTFNSAINTTGNAAYNQPSDTIIVTTNPTNIEPCVIVPLIGKEVCLGFTVNVAPTLSYTLPVTTANLNFETAHETKHIRISPKTVNLIKHNGYIEISSDVSIW